MSLLQRVGRNSAIYTVTTFLQKGVSFLLLPLYTRYLSPEDYGILAVVGSLSGVLAVFLNLSLHASVTRYYFSYRSEPNVLKEFWGTILVLVTLISLGAGVTLLLVGQYLLAPLYGDIAWPYVSLGIATIMLQPVTTIFLSILQTREQADLYAMHTLAQFALTVTMIVSFVVFLGWNAEGPLVAGLITAILYFVISMYSLRGEYRLCFRRNYALQALNYSLPLVPHILASQVIAASDRMFLNQMISTASAGIYNIGAVFGGVVSIVTDGANRAYVPASMDALQTNSPDRLMELRRAGLVLVTSYSLFALAISLFAKEIIGLLTTRPFHDSYIVVPWIAFSFVATGLYYLFVNILFYHVHMTWIVALGTTLGAGVHIGLNYFLIGRFGLVGAAMASFCAQLLGATLIAAIGRVYDPVAWDYVKLTAVPIFSLIVALCINEVQIPSGIALAGLKTITFVCIYCVFNLALWRDVGFLLRQVSIVVRSLDKVVAQV